MSNRAERRRQKRNGFDPSALQLPEGQFSVQMGWEPDEANLDNAKRDVTDSLVELMGEGRTGEVRCAWGTGAKALAMVAVLEAHGTSGLWREYAAQARGRLEAMGGWLVVAVAPGQAPEESYG